MIEFDLTAPLVILTDTLAGVRVVGPPPISLTIGVAVYPEPESVTTI